MPAKKEYLSSASQRAIKIVAAIIGGYSLSITLHLLLASFFPQVAMEIMFSATYTLFLVWIFLMVLAFYARSGWVVLSAYFLLSILFLAVVYSFKQ